MTETKHLSFYQSHDTQYNIPWNFVGAIRLVSMVHSHAGHILLGTLLTLSGVSVRGESRNHTATRQEIKRASDGLSQLTYTV